MFDRPKSTAGCSANGRRRRRIYIHIHTYTYIQIFNTDVLQNTFNNHCCVTFRPQLLALFRDSVGLRTLYVYLFGTSSTCTCNRAAPNITHATQCKDRSTTLHLQNTSVRTATAQVRDSRYGPWVRTPDC